MTTTLSPRRLAVSFAALAALTLAAPAMAQPARRGPDVSARLTRITEGLALTPDQQARLAGLAARTTASEPGASWALAADLKALLTPSQIVQLQQARSARRADADRAGRSRDGRPRGRRADRPDGARRGDRREARRPDRPTSEQRTAVREIAEAFRPRQEALVERFRSGALSASQFVSQREALRADREAQIDAALTPEQRAARAEQRVRREAAKEAREAALGLTSEQQEALQAIALERLRTPPQRPARGERPTPEQREAVRTQRRAQAEAMREQMDAILTPDQQAIVTLHHALTGGRGHRGGARRGRAR